MGKNNKLINSLNEIARRNRSQNVATAADQMVPQIYAAIAIALHRTYGFGYKRINDIFVESQHIWEDYAGDGAGMVKKCEEETGVTVCSPEEAQRLMEMLPFSGSVLTTTFSNSSTVLRRPVTLSL